MSSATRHIRKPVRKKTENSYKSAKTMHKQGMTAVWELEQDPGTGKGHRWGKPEQSFA